MVNRVQNFEPDNDPPSIDESWWEAVLAEDDAQHNSHPTRSHNQPIQNARPPTDSINVDWERALRLYQHDQIVPLEVTGYNRGGLLVTGNGLQGFLPISHLVEVPDEQSTIEDWLESFKGLTLNLKVIECDYERGRVVFSERAALARPGMRNHLLDHMKPGDIVKGTVTNITDFGVFVDLGGVEGLVHVSELSWGRVNHPTDVVGLGENMQVYVIQIDRPRARVALSVKRLYPNPWDTADLHYKPGQLVEAVVTSIVPFGAFARLEDGLDGLIHISEICPGEINIPICEYLRTGQRIQVRILHVDCARQRMGLSLITNGAA